MSYNYSKKKCCKGKSVLICILIFLTLGLAVGLLASLTDGFKNWDASTWISKSVKKECEHVYENGVCKNCGEKEPVAVDNNGKVLTSSSVLTEMPTSLTFLSTRASTVEDGILITAKFTPENATMTNLKWTVDWKYDGVTEEQNMWAGNCELLLDQIIQLTTTAKTCRVKCLKAFGCPIILKCESVSNPSAFATCQLDYAARVESVSHPFLYDDGGSDIYYDYTNEGGVNKVSGYFGKVIGGYTTLYEDQIDYTYGVGTITDKFQPVNYLFTCDSTLLTYLADDWGLTNGQSVTYSTNSCNVTFDLDMFGKLFAFCERYSAEEKQYFEDLYQNQIFPYIMNNCGGHIFDVEVTYKGTYSTHIQTFSFYVSSYSYGTNIDTLELTKSNITL